MGEEDRGGMGQFQEATMNAGLMDIKQESSVNSYAYGHGSSGEEFQAMKPSGWPHQMVVPASSPKSCVTSFSSSNMLDFSNNLADAKPSLPDPSSEVRLRDIYIYIYIPIFPI